MYPICPVIHLPAFEFGPNFFVIFIQNGFDQNLNFAAAFVGRVIAGKDLQIPQHVQMQETPPGNKAAHDQFIIIHNPQIFVVAADGVVKFAPPNADMIGHTHDVANCFGINRTRNAFGILVGIPRQRVDGHCCSVCAVSHGKSGAPCFAGFKRIVIANNNRRVVGINKIVSPPMAQNLVG